jgi:hypothetical protein
VQKVYLGTNEVWSSYAYLLDDYSGAAAAYSLRLLRSAYTGSAIKVRRASDNTEQDIGFVNNELDTSSLATFCSGTNGFVTTWYDQSGSGNDATQSTAVNQPQIVSAGSVILKNGKPCIQFDGTNDDLINTSTNEITTGTIISVVSSDSITQDSVCIQISTFFTPTVNNIAFSQGFGGVGTSDAFGTRSRGTSDIFRGKSGKGTDQLLAFQYGEMGVSNNLYVDGVLETASIGARNTGSDTNFVTLGSRVGFNYFNGKYSEAIVYLSDESANRTGIQDNINDFYSIY